MEGNPSIYKGLWGYPKGVRGVPTGTRAELFRVLNRKGKIRVAPI